MKYLYGEVFVRRTVDELVRLRAECARLAQYAALLEFVRMHAPRGGA